MLRVLKVEEMSWFANLSVRSVTMIRVPTLAYSSSEREVYFNVGITMFVALMITHLGLLTVPVTTQNLGFLYYSLGCPILALLSTSAFRYSIV